MPVDPIEIFISAFQTLAARLFCFFAPLFVSTVTAKYLSGVDLGPTSWTEPWKDLFFPFPEAAAERVVGRTTGFSAWDELKEQMLAPSMVSLQDWESLERNQNGRWVRV